MYFLGQMAVGKSTLFKSFAKQLKPFEGDILLDNKSIYNFSNKEYSKNVGILFQEQKQSIHLTVKEILNISRYSYLNLFDQLSKNDEEKIDKAMNLTNTYQFKDKIIDELSSGQKQLVWIAMLIAQDSKYMFLDEPTTYLDLKNQFEIMNCIKRINKELNKTIILILHDINLAAQYADYIFMLKDKKIKYKGLPIEILSEGHIKDIYDINVKIIKEDKNILICPFN